jgi:DNA repair protein RadD
LRDYQRTAVDATVQHFRGSDAPACLVLPTGAGKSLIIAELARLARGRVLVLAHVKELCEQNYEKFSRSGLEAGIFVAGLQRKEADRAVTFASVQSVHRNLDQFLEPVSLLVIDECHRLSDDDGSQFQQVIRHLRQRSPKLKLLGLTATPYRLGYGWIYRYHHAGKVRGTDAEQPPPFERCVYEVNLTHLIRRGFLTTPRVIDAPVAMYNFDSLSADADGRISDQAVDSLLVQHPRVTQSIVSQVAELAATRRGVMLFAATVRHAKEIASYLPAEQTGLVLGDTPSAERDAVIANFKAQKLKYLVNVSVLTTGFDAPHVDVIALLRRTESVGLFQQIAGRGLRLYPGKTDCLIIDYAGNGFSLFQPEVGERRPPGSVVVTVPCPECGHENQFWGHTDADGHVVEHYGRRCQGLLRAVADEHSPLGVEHTDTKPSADGRLLTNEGATQPNARTVRRVKTGSAEHQCAYRFRFKECGACGAECDIAARRCPECERDLVDPDDQLKAALRLKDALVLRVAGMTFSAKEERLCITYHDEDGQELREFFDFSHAGQRAVFRRVFTRRLRGVTSGATSSTAMSGATSSTAMSGATSSTAMSGATSSTAMSGAATSSTTRLSATSGTTTSGAATSSTTRLSATPGTTTSGAATSLAVRPPPVVESASDAVRMANHFKHPDFVVARKVKQYWRVQTRLFDYEGRYRKANSLR